MDAEKKIPEEALKQLDSLFDALSVVAEDTYVFLCDMRYDYSRWSKELVAAFELPSEYMYNAGLIWEEYVHPDDRDAYHRGLDAIFSGTQTDHDMLYRARRPDGEYDICTCRGLVLNDTSGVPIYFGGAIRNHSQRSHIDPLTGLRSQYGFFADLQRHIRNKTPIRIGLAGVSKTVP